MRVQLLIEGEGAWPAARALAELPGLEVEVTAVDGPTPAKSVATLSVVATIVGFASGAASLADTIIRWRHRWSERDTHHVERVVLVADGRRAALDSLDAADLTELLRRDEGAQS
jgi:hypothetical protein